MKRLTRLAFAAAIALPMLSACGLRGDLKRPDPILSDAPKEEAKPAPVTTTRTVTRTTGPRYNSEGGIIPDASPSTPVSEGGLEDVPEE